MGDSLCCLKNPSFFSLFLPAKQNKSRALVLIDIDLHLSIYKKDVHKSIWTPEFILRQKYCSSFKIIISKRNFANQPHILFSSPPPFGENVYSTLQTLPKRGLLQYALIVNQFRTFGINYLKRQFFRQSTCLHIDCIL